MMSASNTAPPQVVAARAGNPTVRNLLVLATFLLTFHMPGLTQRTEQSQTDSSVTASDLPRFHKVHSYLWRGGAPSLAGLNELKKLGVKTIVDLRRTPGLIYAERKYCALIGINYVSLPLGNSLPPLFKQQQFLHLVNAACNNPQQAPLFLHCSHGSDRTGYLTALWRVQHDHWCIAEAICEALSYGFIVHKLNPNERNDT
jgi:protein tyrosine/serine phosphatase